MSNPSCFTACILVACCLVPMTSYGKKPGGGGRGSDPEYTVVVLAPPGIEITGSQARDFDNAGNVVGFYSTATAERNGFHYNQSTQEYLLFAEGIEVSGLNNLGEMVGTDYNSGDGLFWRNPNDQAPIVLAPLPGHTRSEGWRINEAGIIIGRSQGDGFPSAVAWAVDDNGSVSAAIELPFPIGDVRGDAVSVNEEGDDGVTQIVGYSGVATLRETAVRWEVGIVDGVLTLVSGPTDIGSLDGGASAAYGINGLGDIVGQSHGRPFAKFAGEAMKALSAIRKAQFGHASGANDLGEIVGSQGYLSRGVSVNKAVLWRSDGSVVELAKLVALGASETLTDTVAINNAGQILATGHFPSVTDTGNVACLLIPAT